jgi:RNA polymerase sigma-70 factor (sigma-E family)
VNAAAREAYGAYVGARLPSLRRTAYLLCGDWHTADDLAQAALVKLYLSWRRVERTEALDGYVRRTVVRLWLDQVRSTRWRREHLVGVPPDDAATGTGDADGAAVLRAALGRLTPRQRAVLVLRFWEDLDVRETAAALGVAEGTVKSQTSKALAGVRTALEQLGVTGTGLHEILTDVGERP